MDEPSAALAQTPRCYSPVDFLLLLDGSGLVVQRREVDDREVSLDSRAADGQ